MNHLATKLYIKGLAAKNKMVKKLMEEKGDTNIIAIIIILAIVIALAIIFRGAIMGLFNQIWGSLTADVQNAI